MEKVVKIETNVEVINQTAPNAYHVWARDKVRNIPWVNRAVAEVSWPPSHQYTKEFILPAAIALLVLIGIHLISIILSKERKRKVFGVPADVAGEGIAYRNKRFLGLLETPFEGGNTIAALFQISVKRNTNRPLLGTRKLIKKENEVDKVTGRAFEKLTLGEYIWETYGQVEERVGHFASGLIGLGHNPGERIAIFAETRAEWYIALQSAFRQKLVVVTIYDSLGEDALVHSLNETEVSTVIVDVKRLAKIKDVASQLKSVKRVVYMEEQGAETTPPSFPDGVRVESFSVTEKLGQENPVLPDMPTPSDKAVIMYTSGSTGLPKGVVMSHANLVATIAAVLNVVPNVNNKDIYIAYLPLAHVLELAAETGMAAVGIAIGYSTPLTLSDTASKIKKGTKGDAPVLKPTLMAAVPAILDRIRDGVTKKIDHSGSVVKALFDLAYRRRLAAIEGSWWGAYGLEKLFWDLVVFRKVRAVVGGKLRFVLSGGAPLSADSQRFMNICFGMPIGQGYGLTETCAGATFSEWDDPTVGRVGPPIPCCYIKLINWEESGYRVTDKPYPRGEICIGGPSVTVGYFNNKEKTDEVFSTDERGVRWFNSGDIGQFHPDGVLEIIDRKKDIVKLQAGEYLSLGKVESALARCPYVTNIMMYADSSKHHAVALIVADEPALTGWAEKQGVKYSTFEELCESKEAKAEVLKSLGQVGKESKMERFELPKNIMLLTTPWTPDSGFVTAALKLKRENVRKAFKDDLTLLYKET